MKCIECGGTGEIWTEGDESIDIIECEVCNGSGEVPDPGEGATDGDV